MFVSPFYQDDAYCINLTHVTAFKKYNSIRISVDNKRITVFAIGFHLVNEKVIYWNFKTADERDLCLMNLQNYLKTDGITDK